MPLGAKVALARLHVLNAIVEQDLALPRHDEHHLAVGFVLVVADGCALFERPAHNAGRPVKVHLGLEFLFTALEIGEDGRIHSFQINNQTAFPCGSYGWDYCEFELLDTGRMTISILGDVTNQIDLEFESIEFSRRSKD